MSLLARWRQSRRAGQPFSGHACWTDDYSIVPRPGYYALTDDGKQILAHVPLVYVDDAPGDHLDGSGHYEYAGPKDQPQRQGNPVALEAHAVGHTEVNP